RALQGVRGGIENLQPVVRSVHGEQQLASGGEGQRTDLSCLEQRERRSGGGRALGLPRQARPGGLQYRQQECSEKSDRDITFHAAREPSRQTAFERFSHS